MLSPRSWAGATDSGVCGHCLESPRIDCVLFELCCDDGALAEVAVHASGGACVVCGGGGRDTKQQEPNHPPTRTGDLQLLILTPNKLQFQHHGTSHPLLIHVDQS